MNSSELKALEQRYQAWSTEDLVQAITVDADQYDPGAVELMKRELDGRNISQPERDALQASIAKKNEEQTKAMSGIRCAMEEPLHPLLENRIKATDRTYLRIRDDPDLATTKGFLEQMWARFAPFADRNFRSAIAQSFHSRFWEMYLGYALLLNKKELVPAPDAGPDICVIGLPERLWIEATAPSAGKGPDAVPEEQLGVWYRLPSDAIILRLRSAIEEKFQKYKTYSDGGVLSPSESFVIGINGRGLPSAEAETDLPRIVKAVFPFGSSYITINKNTMEKVGEGYTYRAEIIKSSSKPVSTTVFQDPRYAGISAILYCNSNVGNRPPEESAIGLDFSIVHNPLARNPVPHRWLPCGREFWVEEDRLIINDWYKEHA